MTVIGMLLIILLRIRLQHPNLTHDCGHKLRVCMLSVQLFATPCNPMPGSPVTGFSRQEYWSGLPFPPPWDLPHLGIEPCIGWQILYHCTIWEAWSQDGLFRMDFSKGNYTTGLISSSNFNVFCYTK